MTRGRPSERALRNLDQGEDDALLATEPVPGRVGMRLAGQHAGHIDDGRTGVAGVPHRAAADDAESTVTHLAVLAERYSASTTMSALRASTPSTRGGRPSRTAATKSAICAA